jgi:uncharacterized membrane protein
MADQQYLVMIAGVYDDVEDAKADFKSIEDLHHKKALAFYESAVFEKDADGQVKILDTDKVTRGRGAAIGAIAGGVLGLAFPPFLLLAGLGAGAGALVGNLASVLGRGNIKEFGEMLDRGQAGVILVGHPTVEGAVEGALTRATEVRKQGVEASADAIQDYVEESDNPI